MPMQYEQVIQAARQRAEASIVGLEQRRQAELAAAAAEGREPFPIQPLVEVLADAVAEVVAAIPPTVKPEVADIVGVYRASLARSKGRKVNISSEQFLAVLNAAKVKEGGNAEVQG